MSLEKIKKSVKDWSGGFEPEGETKREVNASIDSIKYQLECEISDQAKVFRQMVNALDIDDDY
jgi:hypothetical protein